MATIEPSHKNSSDDSDSPTPMRGVQGNAVNNFRGLLEKLDQIRTQADEVISDLADVTLELQAEQAIWLCNPCNPPRNATNREGRENADSAKAIFRFTLRGRWKKLKRSKWQVLCDKGIAHHNAANKPFVPPQPLLACLLNEKWKLLSDPHQPWVIRDPELWHNIKLLLDEAVYRPGVVLGWCLTITRRLRRDRDNERDASEADERHRCLMAIEVLWLIFRQVPSTQLLPIRTQIVHETKSYYQALISYHEFQQERTHEFRDDRIRTTYRQWKRLEFPSSKVTICNNLVRYYTEGYTLTDEEAAKAGKFDEKWIDSSDDEEKVVQPGDATDESDAEFADYLQQNIAFKRPPKLCNQHGEGHPNKRRLQRAQIR